jgi:hypothetical protein
MLDEYLYRFATDESSINLSIGQSMNTMNPVVSAVCADATRVDDGGGSQLCASRLRGSLINITQHDRTSVLRFLDEESGGLEAMGSAVYKSADANFASHILAVDSVESFGEDRGTGLSLLLMGATLETLSSGRIITAVLEACPFYPQELTPAELAIARKKLFAHWAKLGFARVSPRSKYMHLTAEDYAIPQSLLDD